MAYKCRMCGNEKYEKDNISTTGGFFSRIFDVSNRKFIAVSCTKCGHTELFKENRNGLMDFVDFLGS